MKPDLSNGVRLAVFLFLVNVLLAIGSYAFGCISYASMECGIADGFTWILHHPIFPSEIPAATVFGFVFGAFGSGLSRYKGLIAWIVIILLTAAFSILVIPEKYIFWVS